MGLPSAQVEVEKKCYRNQTAGWLGVVQLDHLGARAGISIEPYGHIYLSDEEAILTSRAPKDPKDNPFAEQEFTFVDENGQHVQKMMRPLVLVEDAREVPADERFVPGHPESPKPPPAHDLSLPAVAAAGRDTADALTDESDREVPSAPSASPVFAPSALAAVPPSHATAAALPGDAPTPPEADVAASWTENPSRTVEPQPGTLGGANGAPAGAEAPVPGPLSDGPPQRPVQTQVASSTVDTASQNGEPNASESSGTGQANGGAIEEGAVGEETAGVTSTGEETGAAEQPEGQAPEGEFASHEEVGSPDAPTQSAP